MPEYKSIALDDLRAMRDAMSKAIQRLENGEMDRHLMDELRGVETRISEAIDEAASNRPPS